MLFSRIKAIEAQILADARAHADARRLVAIPGVGWMSAHAAIAAIGDASRFATARDFAAWAGLTPRQQSSGAKRRSGHISRAGDKSLRRLFVLGASAVMRQARIKPQNAGPWMTGILARRPVRIAVVAQAARTARTLFAVLKSGADYSANHRAGPAAA